MPVNPTYPGVYIEEIPSGVRTIRGVATSVAAFVGSFQRGLLDEAVQIFSMGDFEREYGGLDRNSETSYAIQQFFLNGGSEAHVVRVADTATGAAAAPPTNANAASAILEDQPAAGAQMFRATAGRRIRGEAARNPGTWGNFLRLEADYATASPASLFNLTVQEVRLDGDRTVVLRTETFRNLTMEPDTPNNALEVVNQGSLLVQLDRDGMPALVAPAPGSPWPRPASHGTLGAALPASPVSIPPTGSSLNVTVSGFPIINGTLDYVGAPPTSYAGLRPLLEAEIRSRAASLPDAQRGLLANASVQLLGDGSTAEPFRYFVRLGRDARPFDPARSITFAGAAAGAAPGVRLSAGAVINRQQGALSGGRDGTPPAPGTTHRPIPVGFFAGAIGPKTGMYALEDVDLFNILCIPEATTMSADDMRSLYAEAESYVGDRRAMLIADIPASVRTLDQMQTWLNDNAGLRHPNSAVYFPRANVPDPLNRNRPRSLANCGTIAGLWARTDAERGVWKAPAGTEARLRNVVTLDYKLTDQENGVLNPLGVNCLRTFPVYSSICWGARTLDGADVIASDFKYIPVRRITLFIEESLFRGTQWVVFEPNDEPLWAQIRLNVGAFMQDLFRKGAFQGKSPREAYFVKCDSETTTQQDIDSGIVNVEVGFAPLKPAEFVILKIQQIARRADV
ncbi:phage tail sheath family protein [Hansschlegelia zhihuaiae]|uniref:Phage tail protein n=1 Tax=Hansschlegelia zhihuaiae TaxID=405005 RepID=A0A4Q0MKZ7_9HYPH|nr:phage tail sheath C-terminal domain-containing protein [Hansschlegelia zhihuaiae]RXF74135.1 phage tail protein [Hansschlegelia zhihuaiae]